MEIICSNKKNVGDHTEDPAGLSGNFIKIEGHKKAVAAGGGAGMVTVHLAVKKPVVRGVMAYLTAGPRNKDSATS